MKKRELPMGRRHPLFEVVHIDEPANNMATFHWHDFLEISFVEKGAGRYEIEDKVYEVTAGDIIIVNDIERHRVTYDQNRPLYETVIHFLPDLIRGGATSEASRGEYLDLFDYESMRFVNKPSLEGEIRREIRRIVHRITGEYRGRQSHYELLIRAKLLELIALLLRTVDATRAEPRDNAQRRTNIRKLEEIIGYLKKNLAAEVSLSGLAARFGYHPSYFSEYFKANIGVGFHEYLARLRVQESLRMLNEGKLTATRIAYECGFNTVASFYAAFRKVMGTTPRKYLQIR